MKIPGSFKDPMGSVEVHADSISRLCHSRYRAEVDEFLASPLYTMLVEKQWIVPATWDESRQSYQQPRINQWVYPYEWSFSMLKAAALLTLRIQEESLRHGYTLKDASAFNVVFCQLQPIHVDLFSFQKVATEIVWQGFDQFYREFLNPLLLESIFGQPFQGMYRGNLNGIETATLARFCKFPYRLSPSIFRNVVLKSYFARLASARKYRSQPAVDVPASALLRLQLRNTATLIREVTRLQSSQHSSWTTYQDSRSYSDDAVNSKRRFVTDFLVEQTGKSLVDYGCNTGEFIATAAQYCSHVVGLDSDAGCIDSLYQRVSSSIPPLPVTLGVVDLANPSAGTGWRTTERSSVQDRLLPTDCFLALALIHHLRIACSIPSSLLIDYFGDFHRSGVLEYISMHDPMAATLLQNRPGLDCSDYEEGAFRACIAKRFIIREEQAVTATRTLFWLESL